MHTYLQVLCGWHYTVLAVPHSTPVVTITLTLKTHPRQWVTLDTAILQYLRSRMLTSVSPFFFTPRLMVSIYISVLVFLWAHTGYLHVQHCSGWLSSLRLICPYQRSRFIIRCVAISWTVAVSLIPSFLTRCLRLTPCIHRNILNSVLFISISSLFYIVQHAASYVILRF